MEYDKCLISLYENENPLPKMFVSLYKRADKMEVKLTSQAFEQGTLFLCANGKVMYKTLETKEDGFTLNKAFNFSENYVFCYITQKSIFIGEKGQVKQRDKAIEYFKKIDKELSKMQDREELAFDRNYIVDNIISKLFLDSGQLFFEQTKKHLFAIFSAFERAEEIEGIIPYSKFVRQGIEGERSYVGIVYKNKLPYAIGIGFDSESHVPIREGAYQYLFDKGDCLVNKSKGKAFYFSFRRVSDADVVFLPL